LLASIDAVLGWLTGRWWRLLLLGLTIAALGLVELNRSHPAPFTIQSGRASSMELTLAGLERGDPIGTVRTHDQLSVAGSGDDPGLYLTVPWITKLVGSDDPVEVLRWLCFLAFALTIAVYPLLIYHLTGSRLGAVASPVALLGALVFMPLGDIYWVAAWGVLTLIPVLMLLDRRWPGWGLAAVCGILVLASLTSFIRGQAGLPVFLVAALVVAGFCVWVVR